MSILIFGHKHHAIMLFNDLSLPVVWWTLRDSQARIFKKRNKLYIPGSQKFFPQVRNVHSNLLRMLDLCVEMSSNIIRGPTRSENDRHLLRVFPNLFSQITAFSRRAKAVTFSSPVSSHNARIAWDHDPPLGDQVRRRRRRRRTACIFRLRLSYGTLSKKRCLR